MRHFAVLVLGPDIEKQLQPFHEYECTGVDDEYVVDVDVTDEITEQFNKEQRVVILASGRVLSRWADELYTAPSTNRISAKLWQKEFELPPGAVERDMAADEARTHGIGYLTMDAAAEEWCGAKVAPDGRYNLHTNPSKKWEWGQIGGRWTGFL